MQIEEHEWITEIPPEIEDHMPWIDAMLRDDRTFSPEPHEKEYIEKRLGPGAQHRINRLRGANI